MVHGVARLNASVVLTGKSQLRKLSPEGVAGGVSQEACYRPEGGGPWAFIRGKRLFVVSYWIILSGIPFAIGIAFQVGKSS